MTLQLVTEALRLVNNIYEDQPKAGRVAWAMTMWNALGKPLLYPNLTADQRAIIDQAEKSGAMFGVEAPKK